MNSTNILESFRTQKYLAAVLVVTLLTWMFGVPAWKHTANAASLTDVSDTLSDSDLGVGSNHTIVFTVPASASGVGAGESFSITFPAGFDLQDLTFNDIDMATTSGEVALAAAASGETWGVATTSAQVLTFTSATGIIATSTTVTIQIGTNATTGATGDTQILNNVAGGSYVVSIALPQDSASTRIVIVDNVVVTASVATVFDFTVAGVASGQTVNGSATTTADVTTATTMPFGDLSAGSSKTLAQDLTVTTNAANGFSVTVKQGGNLVSSTGADIDGFIDGAYTETPSAWQAPSAVFGNENTYGHLAMTSDDVDVFPSSDTWIAASTTARQIMTWDAPTNATTTRFGLQVGISAFQEAGTDYTNTLTYIATPTF